jgi:hypothetical protein
MESEERWGDLFSHSQGLLAELAQQALGGVLPSIEPFQPT